MTVSELILALSVLPSDAIVIMQRDSEGNGYGPLRMVETDVVYLADSTYSGRVYPLEWDADDACMDEDEWDYIVENAPVAVVLVPVN